MERPARQEILGAIALVGVVAGLLLPKALAVSLDRGTFLVLATGVAIGLLQALEGRLRALAVLGASALGAFAMAIALVFAVAARVGADRLQGQLTEFMNLSAMRVDGTHYVGLFVPFSLISTFFIGVISAFASRLLLAGARSLFVFGAEGVEKVSRILTAIVAMIAVIFSLWAAFG